MLGDRGQDVDRKFGSVWIIHCNELHTRVHQSRNKCDVPGQAIELGNDELSFLFLAGRERLLQPRPVVTLATPDFRELRNQRPPPSIEIAEDGFSLRLKAKTGLALFVRTDTEVGDEFALMWRHKK